jgi:hypothetical protein
MPSSHFSVFPCSFSQFPYTHGLLFFLLSNIFVVFLFFMSLWDQVQHLRWKPHLFHSLYLSVPSQPFSFSTVNYVGLYSRFSLASSFRILSIRDILMDLLSASISTASILFLFFFVNLHVSDPYMNILFINVSYIYLLSLSISLLPMLCGSLVTTAWRVLRLRMEETPSRYGG